MIAACSELDSILQPGSWSSQAFQPDSDARSGARQLRNLRNLRNSADGADKLAACRCGLLFSRSLLRGAAPP